MHKGMKETCNVMKHYNLQHFVIHVRILSYCTFTLSWAYFSTCIFQHSNFSLQNFKVITLRGITWSPHLPTDKFPGLFQYFFSIFQYLSVFLMNLTNTKIYLTNTLQLKMKNRIITKKWLKFPDFSSILDKIPWIFQSLQNSLTGKCFPIFQSMWKPCISMKTT